MYSISGLIELKYPPSMKHKKKMTNNTDVTMSQLCVTYYLLRWSVMKWIIFIMNKSTRHVKHIYMYKKKKITEKTFDSFTHAGQFQLPQ